MAMTFTVGRTNAGLIACEPMCWAHSIPVPLSGLYTIYRPSSSSQYCCLFLFSRRRWRSCPCNLYSGINPYAISSLSRWECSWYFSFYNRLNCFTYFFVLSVGLRLYISCFSISWHYKRDVLIHIIVHWLKMIVKPFSINCHVFFLNLLSFLLLNFQVIICRVLPFGFDRMSVYENFINQEMIPAAIWS